MASKSERLQFESLIHNDRQNKRIHVVKKVPERIVETKVNIPRNVTKRDIVWEERRQKRLSGQIEKLTINHNIKDSMIDNDRNRRVYNFDGMNTNNVQYNHDIDNKLQSNNTNDNYDNYSKQPTPYKNEMNYENVNNMKEYQKYIPQDNIIPNKTPMSNSEMNYQHSNINKNIRTPNSNTGNYDYYNNKNYQKSNTYDDYNKVNTLNNDNYNNKSQTPYSQYNGYESKINNQYNNITQPRNNQNIRTPYNHNNINQQNINYNQQGNTAYQHNQNSYDRLTPGYTQQRQTPNQPIYVNNRQTPNNQIYYDKIQPDYYNQNIGYINNPTPGHSQRQTPMQYPNQSHQRVFSPEVNNPNYSNYSQRNPIIQNTRDTYTPGQKPFNNVSFRNNDINRNNSAYIGRDNNKFNYKI